MKRRFAVMMFLPPAFAGFLLLHVQSASSQTPPGAKDPGVRRGPASAGGPLPGLTESEPAHFDEGKTDFERGRGRSVMVSGRP